MKESQNYSYQNIFDTFDSTEFGLDINEATFRKVKYGPNQITPSAKKSLLISFLEEYKDPMMLLLILATGLSLFSGDTTDAVLIFIVLMLNGTISFFQKHKAEKAIEALKKMVTPQARVFRNHQQILADTKDIVPGDVIILNEGDSVPADSIVFQANELETSEAILTGESFPIKKQAFDTTIKGNSTTVDNIIFTGTTIARGNAKALVIRTGMETEFGKIASLTQDTKPDATPLQKEIHSIGIFAAKVTLVISVLIFAIEYIFRHLNLVENLIFTASVAVAAVPEGLPAVITIAMALGVQHLSKKKAIIRQLTSVETLGSTSVICTDKTGTLTKNEMSVTEGLVDDFFIKFDNHGYQPVGNFTITHGETEHTLNQSHLTDQFSRQHASLATGLKWLSICSMLCNNSSLIYRNSNYSVLGDPTEGGLLVMAKKIQSSQEDKFLENLKEVHELPFDSERKVMSKIFLDQKAGKYYIFSKGAPESLIPLCDQRLHQGKEVIFTKGLKEEMLSIANQFSENALRNIALAYREIPGKHLEEYLHLESFQEKVNQIEKKLTYIGLVGITDPPRQEIAEAVKMTRQAGIRTYIITGDHGATAAAIAKQTGLISDQKPYEIITGVELDQTSDQELKDKLSNHQLEIIFARTRPEHKLRVVSLLKDLGEIVAVTGDGVNDAPALKRADIGVAMGITGSDVSKEAASMVLMDDSYSTIITAIKEGRIIFSNLKKFIYYIFSSNIGEVFVIFVSLVAGLIPPLSAVLILTINFVTDLFPALALGIEPAEKNIMHQKPRSHEEKIMNKDMIKKILTTGFLMGFIIMGLYLYKLIVGGWSYGQEPQALLFAQASSLTFIAMVLLQVTNSFNSKSTSQSIFRINPFNNPSLLWANLFSVAMAVLIVEIPFLQQYFGTTGLDLIDWGLIVLSCVLLTIFLEISKKFTKSTK